MTEKLGKSIWVHVLIILAILSRPLWLSIQNYEIEPWWLAPSIIRDFIANLFIIIFFYTNIFILIPKFYAKGKFGIYLVLILLVFLTLAFVPSAIMHPYFLNPSALHFLSGKDVQENMPWENFTYAVRHQLFFLTTIVLGSLMIYQINHINKIEQSKKDAVLSSLISQVNPHFLFNALNNLFALSVKEQAHQTSTSILKLSGLMRYNMLFMENNYVPLTDEITFIEDYINLQSLRLTQNIKIQFERSPVFPYKNIASHLLMPFIENCYKYGINPDEECFISIKIFFHDDTLHFQAFNKKVFTANHQKSNRLGIANSIERLKLQYKDQHHITIEDQPEFFKVSLSLKLS